jgi:hypothetical protein
VLAIEINKTLLLKPDMVTDALVIPALGRLNSKITSLRPAWAT